MASISCVALHRRVYCGMLPWAFCMQEIRSILEPRVTIKFESGLDCMSITLIGFVAVVSSRYPARS